MLPYGLRVKMYYESTYGRECHYDGDTRLRESVNIVSFGNIVVAITYGRRIISAGINEYAAFVVMVAEWHRSPNIVCQRCLPRGNGRRQMRSRHWREERQHHVVAAQNGIGAARRRDGIGHRRRHIT